jgi:hypothetical protein
VNFEKIKTIPAGHGLFQDDYLSLNGTFYRHQAIIKENYPITSEGWYNVDLVICSVEYQPADHVNDDDTKNGEGDGTTPSPSFSPSLPPSTIDSSSSSLSPVASNSPSSSPSAVPSVGSIAPSLISFSSSPVVEAVAPSYSPSLSASDSTAAAATTATPSLAANTTRRYHRQLRAVSASFSSEGQALPLATVLSNSGSSYNARIDGTITFKNPYGYLPGEFYGLLPFESARLLAYLLVVAWYLYIYNHNKVRNNNLCSECFLRFCFLTLLCSFPVFILFCFFMQFSLSFVFLLLMVHSHSLYLFLFS